MATELQELRNAMDRLGSLEKDLCDAYTNFTIEHTSYVEECQHTQRRSYHDNLKLAKKEARQVAADAAVVTELVTF